jgi:hypothetical protein
MTAQLSANRAGLPPPLEMHLTDGERTIGWISDDRVGFRGFADELEAAHAAWVAHRTLARRLSRTHGTRPLPIDVEPLALRDEAGTEQILAGGRPIAQLVRPGAEGRAGSDSFGFEIRVPPPVDELRVRSMSHLIYRTLRKSGIRWALWRPPVAPAAVERTSPAASGAPASARAGSVPSPARGRRRWALPSLAWLRPRSLAQ